MLFVVEELCNTGTILPETLYSLHMVQRSQTHDDVQTLGHYKGSGKTNYRGSGKNSYEDTVKRATRVWSSPALIRARMSSAQSEDVRGNNLGKSPPSLQEIRGVEANGAVSRLSTPRTVKRNRGLPALP